MIKYACVMTVLIGCGGKGADDCQKAFDRMKPLAKETLGHELGEDESKQQLETCREKTKDGKHDALVDCVLAAKDDAALRVCLAPRKPAPVHATPVDPMVQLDRLGASATAYYGSMNYFVRGKAATLPTGDCCKGPDQMCPSADGEFRKDHVWDALEFRPGGPTHYRYTYESTGPSFTATAVGDPDCSGHEVTYKLEGTIENNHPKLTLTQP